MSQLAVDLFDDPLALATADPAQVLRATASAAAQVRQAVVLANEANIGRFRKEDRPRSVVVLGSGAAAIAGDLLAAAAGGSCPVPILVHRGIGLPHWVGAADLVMAVSNSGSTMETQWGLSDAVRRGCLLLVVAADPSPMADLARRGRGVVVPVPAGRPDGASLWAQAIPLVLAAEALGLLAAPVVVIEETALALEAAARRCGPAADLVVNPAKSLALELLDTLPVLWGGSPLAGVAAFRGACQITENAGIPALSGVLPEVTHHQLALLDGPFVRRDAGDLFADPFEDDLPAAVHSRVRLVLLRDAAESPALAQQTQVVQDLAQERGLGVSALLGAGASELERLAVLIATLDFAAVYLSLLQGRHPGQPTAIDVFKGRISR